MPYQPTAEQVRQLRQDLGVSMMAAREALIVMRGNMDNAQEYLRAPGLKQMLLFDALAQAAQRLGY